jgi:hypothetical protein
MFLSICVLSYDTAELAKGVDKVNSDVLRLGGQLTEVDAPEAGVTKCIGRGEPASLLLMHGNTLDGMADVHRIRDSRVELLKLQQKHLVLKRRRSFLREFADKLGLYFELRVGSEQLHGRRLCDVLANAPEKGRPRTGES